MKLTVIPFLLCAAVLAPAQTQPAAPAITDAQAIEAYTRALQLMDAAGVAIPELARAGAPLITNIRGAMDNLRARSGLAPAEHERVLTNFRAYLALADAVPKPYPLPEETRKQLAELREVFLRSEAYFQQLLERLQAQARDPDRDNLRRYAEANARLGAPTPGKPRVVFLGDSITDGWRLNEYFPERDFVNRGISGQISGQMLGRFYPDVINLKPATVVILAGTNDIARGVSPAVIQYNLTMMADLAASHGIKPIFSTLLPVSDYHKDQDPSYQRSLQRPPSTIQTVNNWIREFCRVRGYTLIDYYPALADSAGMLKAELSADGLHPDAAGYRLMAPLALQAIDKNSVQPQPAKQKRRLF